MKSIIAPTALGLLLASAATAAFAQSGAGEVTEVVVTAQKRSENLQDVPMTINVYGAEQIERSRIQGAQDIITRTTGLNFDLFPRSQPRPIIRGIGSSDRGSAGDPSTVFFIDEVYMGRPAAVSFDAFDVERIEVLKGPQGTLLGKNVVGGAISVFSKRPNPAGFDAEASLTAGNYKRIEATGMVNIPVESLNGAVRASISTRNHDGFVKNLYTGDRVDDQHTTSGRLQLLANPTEDLSILVALDATRDRATGAARHVVAVDPSSSLARTYIIDPDPEHSFGERNGYDNRDTWGVRVNADWDLGFGSLTYIGSYRELQLDNLEDFDGSNPARTSQNIVLGQVEDTSFFSHELRLSAPGDSRLNWVVGGYYYGADTDRHDPRLYDLQPAATPSGTFGQHDDFHQNATVKSYAVFGDATFQLLDNLKVFGGARYSSDEKDYRISTGDTNFLARVTGLFNVGANKSWSSTTWRFGADWNPTEDVLIYGLVSTGFKSGGFQDTPATAASAVIPFNPEHATLYELGVKATLLDGRMTWNNTLYRTEYEDLQVRRTVGLNTFTINAGAARIQGYETALHARVTDAFNLDLGYAFTDARYRSLVDRTTVLSGNRITRNPKHKLTLTPSYTWDLTSGGNVEAALEYQYESKVFDDADNNAFTVRKPRSLWDAHATYELPDGHWSVTLWGKNLTDEVTRAHQVVSRGALLVMYNEPRTFGVTARWKH